MKDGAVKVTFVEGEIQGVSVGAGLDRAYERLFEAARMELKETEPATEAGIRLIVFGCFWLEAVCNKVLRDLLDTSLKPANAAVAIWETVSRGSFQTKLSLVSAFVERQESDTFRQISADLGRVFRLRNRLAHFEEKTVAVAGPMSADQFEAQLCEFPEVDLIRELRPPKTDAVAEAIVNGISWLNQMYYGEADPIKETLA